MSKILELTRKELVWQSKCNSWDEKDFEDLLNWLKSFKDQDTWWAKDHYAEYEFLSAYTWDQICDIFNGYTSEDPTMTYYEKDGEIRYTACISELIKEYMREDNYDCDVSGEEYAGDYDEQWYVMDNHSEDDINEQQ